MAFLKLAATLSSFALLAGCAAVTGEAGLQDVQNSSRTVLAADISKVRNEPEANVVQSRVIQSLKRPLSSDAAVQIALLKNRGLQASLNDLGIAEAQMVQASLPPNPRIGLSRKTGILALEIERQISASIFALATLPVRTAIAKDQFRSAQLRTSEAVFKLAADTRRQYIRAVAANQQVAGLAVAKRTSEATAELVKRLGESGALNKLNQARDFVFDAELGAQLAQARTQARVEKERLVRLLGLWGEDVDKLKLPTALPSLPRLKTVREVEADALRRRIDLEVARSDLEALAKTLGLAEATRFISDVDLLARRTTDRAHIYAADGDYEREKKTFRTLELEIEIPIFDFGQARVAQAEETYMRAANKLAEKAVNIRSEAREAYQAWRGTRDVAALYQSRILPLRKIIQDESLLQYNGMLIDVTQLIADARGRVMSQVAAVNATRDFWLADVDFRHAIIGGGISGAAMSAAGPSAEAGGGGH